MGTVAYMSPEQVRGQPTDHRSDLFSLGTILYEMLTGKRAFQGATSVETMNAILKEDPPEQTEIARNIPPALCRIVDHCLEKNPAERFQSARDVAFALGALSGSVSSASSAVRAGASQAWWPRLRLAAEVALAAVVIVLTLLIARHRPEAPEAPVVASILPPPGDGFWANITQPAAISPDGKFLAVIAMRNGHTQLWLRRLDAADAQPIAGSEGASNPFWSPDSRHIAFFVPGKLRRADISGGSVTDICPSGRFGMGGAWSTRGIIIFSIFGQALRQVPDNGGVPEPIPGNSLPNDALTQMWPAFLPDGKHFLYLDWRYSTNDSRDNVIFIGSLDGEKPRRLPLTGTNAHYSLGYLLFSRDGDLVAQKFDLSRAELSGAILPVARNIQYDTFFHDGMFTVSDTGVIVYGTAGAGENTELTWMDRTGRALGTLGEPGSFQRPSISPDGTRVAVGVRFTDAQEKIWIYDVERNTRIPIVNTQSGSGLYSPVWSPDGKQVAYRTTMGKTSMLLAHNSDGSGEESQPGSVKFDLLSPTAWSPDGRYLALDLAQFQGRQSWQESLRVVQVETGKAVLEIPDAAISRFSPDGHWLAFAKEEDGQVYVTQFPSGGARIAVSSAGGVDPRWRGDGQELFYIDHDLTVVSVQVRETPNEFRVLSSQPLFRLQLPENVGFYDVTRDGKRFLVNIRTTKEQSAPLTLITNWTAHLQQETK
jgi:Tol biopolymer transport system component